MQILIIDLGSQYSMIIDRTLREMGYRAALLEPDKAKKWLKQNQRSEEHTSELQSR